MAQAADLRLAERGLKVGLCAHPVAAVCVLWGSPYRVRLGQHVASSPNGFCMINISALVVKDTSPFAHGQPRHCTIHGAQHEF